MMCRAADQSVRDRAFRGGACRTGRPFKDKSAVRVEVARYAAYDGLIRSFSFFCGGASSELSPGLQTTYCWHMQALKTTVDSGQCLGPIRELSPRTHHDEGIDPKSSSSPSACSAATSAAAHPGAGEHLDVVLTCAKQTSQRHEDEAERALDCLHERTDLCLIFNLAQVAFNVQCLRYCCRDRRVR